jgi:glycosyltransferase involved in cell wall biosynthesis
MPGNPYFNDINERVGRERSAFISVIIPVYNDPDGIKDTLNSLVNQDYGVDNFEIIVVDNGSTDSTLSIINAYIERYPELIRLVIEDKIQSSYAARNKGIISSRGSIIVFIDADMSVYSDWMTKINQSLEEHQWDYLGCNVEIYYKGKSIYEKYDKMKGFPIERYMNETKFAPTCCLVVRKVIFNELGLFDSKLISSGDYEFGNRVINSGHTFHFASNIIMKHPARSSFRQLLQKSFRIGRGQKQLLAYYPGRYDKFRRRLITPSNYLPIMPRKLSFSMRENEIWNQLGLGDKIKIYFIMWLSHLANTFGFFMKNMQVEFEKDDR